MTREELYAQGYWLVQDFIKGNNLKPVTTLPTPKEDWHVGACAYYRRDTIKICIKACAQVGYGGRAWSYPGYVVDRTPYGVMAHELGHHLDFHKSDNKGSYFGDFSVKLREQTGEKPITTYCPNTAEWFAEIARLYITNPDLLRLIRPRTHRELTKVFDPVFSDSWRKRLEGAPERTLKAAANKIDQVRE